MSQHGLIRDFPEYMGIPESQNTGDKNLIKANIYDLLISVTTKLFHSSISYYGKILVAS